MEEDYNCADGLTSSSIGYAIKLLQFGYMIGDIAAIDYDRNLHTNIRRDTDSTGTLTDLPAKDTERIKGGDKES